MNRLYFFQLLLSNGIEKEIKNDSNVRFDSDEESALPKENETKRKYAQKTITKDKKTFKKKCLTKDVKFLKVLKNSEKLLLVFENITINSID